MSVTCVTAAALGAPSSQHLSGVGCQNTRGSAFYRGKWLLTGEERSADEGRALPRLPQLAFLSAHSCLERASR